MKQRLRRNERQNMCAGPHKVVLTYGNMNNFVNTWAFEPPILCLPRAVQLSHYLALYIL